MLYKTIVLELLSKTRNCTNNFAATESSVDAQTLGERTEGQSSGVEGTSRANESGEQRESTLQPSAGNGSEGDRGPFALRIAAGRRTGPVAGRSNGLYPPTFADRVKSSRGQLLLPFDTAHVNEALDNSTIFVPTIAPAHFNTDRLPQSKDAAPFGSASSGEKAKARDILAAIRTLQKIEREQRLTSADEKQILSRFAGFGPVALSIFPDPVTGRFKDAGWEAIGTELKSMLSPAEYDSAKRTTFCAFYTSPMVIAAMHSALEHLGVPGQALCLEPGCGIGLFMRPDKQFIGVELDSLSGRIAKALHPNQDIRIEDFQNSRLPKFDAVIGNVPFANIHLDHNGQNSPCTITSLRNPSINSPPRHYGPHYQPLHARQAKCRDPRISRRPRRFPRRHPPAVRCVQTRRNRRRYRYYLHAETLSGRTAQSIDPDWLTAKPFTIDGNTVPLNGYFLNHPEMVLGTYSGKTRFTAKATASNPTATLPSS